MREPIAIVGMACRFPGGVDSPDALYDLLVARKSAIRDIPPDRWNANAFFHPDFQKVGSIHVKKLGWLSDVDCFDAAFFGISPNEAKRMDVQQRHVLEAAYGAIEDAGVPLEQLAGKNVAVVIGAGASDYGGIMRLASERANIAGPSNPGSALSIISNRVSYLFDLRGPSFTVDTACSSALTALHYACESIWSGVSIAAIAGGANSILSPETTMGFSKGGYLSPDAECRAFSDDANGYVRSEGVAAVFLKPLSKALADGDRIHAMIRGTWINQDGRTQGMTVPSVEAQEDLLRNALRVAGVEPRQVSYVEAHGTGTPAGDPIEANAIGHVVGRASGREDPCVIGSVKTNLGHMECCAGMGGLFKLVLVLQRRKILPNIHFRRANPNINLEELGIAIATDVIDLPSDGPLIGCVNSFGFGGANGHAVLESPPPRALRSTSRRSAETFVVSARSASALAASAAALARDVRAGVELPALADALRARRSRFEFKLAVVESEHEALAGVLEAFASTGEASAHAVAGRAPEGQAEPVVFAYTGQGAQWFAMGRQLLARDEIFAGVIDSIGNVLAKLGWLDGRRDALRAELSRTVEQSRMSETRVAQPCIFALQVALTEMLAARGFKPAAAVGHSIGELAAAVTAGVLDVAEATRIVFWRSECQARVEGAGAMLAVGLDEARARALVASAGGVDIAAINGPSAVTLAGTHTGIATIESALAGTQTFVRRLDVSVPFHSRLMDPIESEFRRQLGIVQARRATIPFYSTVHGRLWDQPLDTNYWYANIREPVRYYDALRALLAARFGCFVEVGPHPALTHGSVDAFRAANARAVWIPTLRRDGDDEHQLAMAVARLFVAGARELRTEAVTHVSLPRYPFARDRYWLETSAGRQTRVQPATALHPHIVRVERNARTPDLFTAELSLDAAVEPYLADHRAQDHIVFPAAGQLELVIAAARHAFETDAFVVEDIEFQRPIVIAEDDTRAARYRLDVYSEEGDFVIVSNDGTPDAPWIEHTRGRIRRSLHPDAGGVDLAALQARASVEVPQPAFYRACETIGLALGPAFKNLATYRTTDDRREFVCHVATRGVTSFDAARFVIHPALLDATIHSLLPVDPARASQRLFLPFRLGRARLFGPPPSDGFWSHARTQWNGGEEFKTELVLCDDTGRVFAKLEGLVARHVHGAATAQGALYSQAWSSVAAEPRPARALDGLWLVYASKTMPHATRAVVHRIVASGGNVVRVVAGDRYAQLEPDLFAIRPGSHEDAAALAAAQQRPVAGIVHMWSLDMAGDARPTETVALGPSAAGHIATALKASGQWPHHAELWLITDGAATADSADRCGWPARASLWGFGRVVMSELRATVTLVDIAPEPSANVLDALAAEIVAGPAEAEVALRERDRDIKRYTRMLGRIERAVAHRHVELETTPVRASTRSPGVLDSIELEVFHRRELAHDEVEIAVHAVGLNFRDVVAAMNLLDDDAWEGGLIGGAQLGLDASGIVTRIGGGVTRFSIGDSVVGFFPHSLATHAITFENQIAQLAPNMTMVDAAALPTPYSTADIALHGLAQLQRGETVLVHAAAGGVGTVAVQLARAAGAHVIATTSTDDKRAFLRELGVSHIFNSRNPEFGDDVMRVTGGNGVDVVLNSLSGRAMTESLRVLRPYGRFVEIGKTDIYRNRHVGLRQFAKNKSYFCLDVNRMFSSPAYPAVVRLERAMAARASGVIAQLPVRTLPFSEARAAVRTLAHGKQIGRVVVEIARTGEVAAVPPSELHLEPTGVHLITGGCSGFGLALAGWLVSKGARRLVLAGRRGIPGPAEQAAVDALVSRGADVVVRRSDISQRADVDALVRDVTSAGRLAGVYHAAMVLDDGAIETLDDGRYARVLEPKADGAMHLHAATHGIPLDHFMLFSSISAAVGTPGQANYAAANAVLDELAMQRAAAGLPATAIGWGPIDDVGIVARASEAQRGKILGHGLRAMASQRAFELLEHVLLSGQPHAVIADIDGRLLARLGGAARRIDASLVAGDTRTASSRERLRDSLLAVSDAERISLLGSALVQIVASIAGLGSAGVDVDASLGRYGFDSLMVTQLQTWIEDQLGLDVAMVRLMRGPSIVELASELVASLGATTSQLGETALVHALNTIDAPRAHLVCFPPMAVEGEAFGVLAAASHSYAVHAVQLPTFDDSSAGLLLEPAHVQLGRLADELASLDGPLVLYGHSMGGYVALSAARALAERGRAPVLVALGAVPTPELPATLSAHTVTTPEDVTDAMAEDVLRRFDHGAALRPNDRARAIALARRDLWLTARGGVADASAPAGQPTLLIAASEDALATLDKLPAPSLRELGYDDVQTVQGSHLFLFDPDACRALLAQIDTNMTRDVPSGGTT